MPSLMKNSILNYDTLTAVGASSSNYNGITYQYSDYTSFDFTNIYKKVQSLTCNSDLFEPYMVNNDDKLERISQEIYGTPDYWDILLLINGLDPLFDMPYVFDVISSMADDNVAQYQLNNPLAYMTASHIAYMQQEYTNEYVTHNENTRTIKIVKPDQIEEFFRLGRSLGCFK